MSVGRITQKDFDTAVKVASTNKTKEITNTLDHIVDLVDGSGAFGPYKPFIEEASAEFAAGVQVGILIAGRSY